MKFSRRPVLAVLILALASSTFVRGGVVPKPEDVLGFAVGADYRLATYDQAIDYLRKVAAVSDRIKLFEMGKTSMGRPMVYAVISSAENIKALDKHKEAARRLSLAEMGDDEARAAAAAGKVVVYIDGGLHASECAPAQHNIQLAYDLVTAADPRRLKILDDVVLVLVFANPDGMNLLAEWYRPNVGTPYEVAPMPWLYHKYAGHDNNRDGYIANLEETRNLSRLVDQEWFPAIVYDHHQTAPFPARIWTPPNSEPTNPNVHPRLVRWQNLIGSAMGAAFDREGKEGAISRIVFDTWYPGYMTQVHDSHNIISILTETALYEYATPHFYTLDDFPKEYQDLTMSAFYPSPWRGGWWRLKDAVDYCETASLAVLETASKYRAELLLDKYLMAREVVDRFTKEPPYAWIVPDAQSDPGAAALLLDRMILLGVKVARSAEPFTCDGISYPKGTLVVPQSQPFGLFVKNVFEEQRYPDLRKYPDLWQGLVTSRKLEGAPLEAYDMMGWTLPYQFNVAATAANTPLAVGLVPEKEVKPSGAGVTGNGAVFVLDHAATASAAAANRALKAGGSVRWAKKPVTAGGREYPAGAVLVAGVKRPLMEKAAADLGLRIATLSSLPNVPAVEIKAPRVGIYQSWIPSEEEGWVRYVLEQNEFAFTPLHDSDVRAGSLRDHFDAIVVPDHWTPKLLVDGFARGTMPPPYVGGLGDQGLANLKAFAEAGGTLLLMNGSANLGPDYLGLPVRNVLKDAKPDEFNCSGSMLRLEFDLENPLAYGMPKQAAGTFAGSCAFDLFPSYEPKRETKSVAKYAGERLLMSGYIFGEKLIQQKTAEAVVQMGTGRAVLLGFGATYRAQSYGTFKLVYNALFTSTAKE